VADSAQIEVRIRMNQKKFIQTLTLSLSNVWAYLAVVPVAPACRAPRRGTKRPPLVTAGTGPPWTHLRRLLHLLSLDSKPSDSPGIPQLVAAVLL
jgi:hypothetical protein